MSSKESKLHYWLSERQRATRQQLRRAWKGLSLASLDGQKMSHSLNRLCRAGHIELDSAGNATVCPPLIILANQSRAFASGARSLRLRRQLLEKLPESTFICLPGECEVWSLSGNPELIRATAEELKLTLIVDRGLELLRTLPDYHSLLDRIEVSGELSATVWQQAFWNHRAGLLLWKDASLNKNRGVYRAKFGHQWKYVMRQDNGSLKELTTSAERAAGIWICLRDQNSSVCYGSENQKIEIIPGLVPPVLLDRGLRMASGMPPERKHGELHYSGIDLNRAHECARLLCTSLRIE